jgi:pyruvate ferredoxin oxidoreductase beta subunit
MSATTTKRNEHGDNRFFPAALCGYHHVGHGSQSAGKVQVKEDLTKLWRTIISLCGETTLIGNSGICTRNRKKAIYTKGPAFLNVMAPARAAGVMNPRDFWPFAKRGGKPAYGRCSRLSRQWILNYEPRPNCGRGISQLQAASSTCSRGQRRMIANVQADVDARWNECSPFAANSNLPDYAQQANYGNPYVLAFR